MTPRYKIERITEQYALADIEDELVELSTSVGDSFSLRDLAIDGDDWLLRTPIEGNDLESF